MKPEDKELLLTDLCARLPYSPMCKSCYEEDPYDNNPYGGLQEIIDSVEGINRIGFDDGRIYVIVGGFECNLSDCKLYLRPMSSMTDEEMKKLLQISNFDSDIDKIYDDYIHLIERTSINIVDIVNFISWLNAHHFDYHGLIEKGLALEAPKDMYNI